MWSCYFALDGAFRPGATLSACHLPLIRIFPHLYADVAGALTDRVGGRTYVFSSPTMQMADRSLTASVIMADWLGSMAKASRARDFSSPRMRSKPYCRQTQYSHTSTEEVTSTVCRYGQ